MGNVLKSHVIVYSHHCSLLDWPVYEMKFISGYIYMYLGQIKL